jgi:hypothetical protein
MIGPLAWALLAPRFVTYILALFVLVSSLGFACPDVYGLSSLSHVSSPMGKVMDPDPCRDLDKNASHSVCYGALYDRLLYRATEFSFPGGHGGQDAAIQTPNVSNTLLFSCPPTTSFQRAPKLALTLLYHALRI